MKEVEYDIQREAKGREVEKRNAMNYSKEKQSCSTVQSPPSLSQQKMIFSPYEKDMYRPQEETCTSKSILSPPSSVPTQDSLNLTPKKKTKSLGMKKLLSSSLSPRKSPSSTLSKSIINAHGKRKKLIWSDDETKILLEVYSKWAKKLRTHNKKAKVWDLIYKQYKLRCKQDKVFTEKLVKQLQDKVRYLNNEFKKITDSNKSTGEKRRDFKYFDAMINIIGDRDSVIPSNVSDVMDADDDDQDFDDLADDQNSQENILEDNPVNNNGENESEPPSTSKRPKRATKQSALSDLVSGLRDSMDQQSKFFEESWKKDRELMERFLEQNANAEKTQLAILQAINNLSKD